VENEIFSLYIFKVNLGQFLISNFCLIFDRIFSKKSKFWSKIQLFVENPNFGQKLKFWWRNEILVTKRNFRQIIKILVKKYFRYHNFIFQPLLLPEGSKPTPLAYHEIIKEIWFELISLTITFCITIAVFPTLVSMYNPIDSQSWISEKYFIPVFCFLNFNVFDFIGREIAGRCRDIVNRKVLGCLVVLRLAVLVLLPMTNCQPRTAPVYFQTDIVYIGMF